MAIDILIRLLSQGGEKVAGDLKGVATSAGQVDKELSKVGDNKGMATAGAQADALRGKLETVRNAGAALAIAGGGALILANNLSESFLEADRLGGKLESLMKGKGLESGIDSVRRLGDEISDLSGKDNDQVSAAIAGAIASGRVAGLRDYGIAIDAAGMEAIEAAGKISQQAKSQEVLNQVLRAGKTAVENLKVGMSDSAIAIGQVNRRWGDLQEGIGKGATEVRAALANGILLPIIGILEKSPELQQTVGHVLAVGGAALSAGGSVLALGSQVGMTVLSMRALGITGVSSMMAIRNFTTATTVGFNLATIAVTGIGIAAAATVGYVAYAVGQHIGLINQEQSYVDRLIAGWERLKALAERQDPSLKQNEKDLESKIAERKAANSEAVLKGSKTQAQADEDNRKEEIRLREQFAREQLRVGDKSNMTKNQEAAARLRAQDGSQSVAPIPSMPSPVMPAATIIGSNAIPESKDAKAQKRDAIKAAAKAERAAAKSAKDLERANKKEARELEKLTDKKNDRAADIAIAVMEEEADTKIAQLEASKGKKGNAAIDAAIAKINADKSLKAAEIRAKYDDSFAESGGLDIARIRYKGDMQRAAIKSAGDGGNGSMIAALQAGRGLSALDGAGGATNATAGNAGAGNGTAGRASVDIGKISKVVQDAAGNYMLEIYGKIPIPNEFQRSAGSYAR